MFENILRGLMPPQRQGAFTPEQMAEFNRQAGMLPPAPSGDFFQVPATSPDRQAGQLLPLRGGQPVPEMAPIMGEADGRQGLRGSSSVDVPRAPTGGIAPLSLDAAARSPKDVFPLPPPGASGRAAEPGDISGQAMRDAIVRAGGNPDFVRVDNLDRGPNSPTGHAANLLLVENDLNKAREARLSGNSIEATLERAREYAASLPNTFSHEGNRRQQDDAVRQYMAWSQPRQQQQADIGAREGLQRLENQGRADVAGIQARANQFGELDKSELHIRDAVGKGLLDKPTGQAMIDAINARRGSIGAGPGGMPPSGSPGQGAPGASGVMSPPITAGADVSSLRSLFGQVGPAGQFAANPASATGQTFSQLIDKIDPSMSPQVVAAIRSGQFGDPAAIKNAAYNSLAQNYLMSQGQMPGGSGQLPGLYTIPYGPEKKPLLNMIASPATNAVNSARKRADFAVSGVPYDMLSLPDGTQIPFDQSGVRGLSEAAAAGGYNQGARATAQQRLSKLAQLVDMLQSTQPPR